jgi:hypothetical protein
MSETRPKIVFLEAHATYMGDDAALNAPVWMALMLVHRRATDRAITSKLFFDYIAYPLFLFSSRSRPLVSLYTLAIIVGSLIRVFQL